MVLTYDVIHTGCHFNIYIVLVSSLEFSETTLDGSTVSFSSKIVLPSKQTTYLIRFGNNIDC